MGIRQHAKDAKGREYDLKIANLEYLGKGSFGYVYKAKVSNTRHPERRTPAAVKFANEKSDGLIELSTLMVLDHPSIVKLLYHFTWRDNQTGATRTHMVLELFDYDLFTFISKKWDKKSGLGIYTEVFMYQLFRGLVYLKARKISHRDLKPENLLIRGHQGILKLTDFGCAKRMNKAGLKHSHYVGTRYYRYHIGKHYLTSLITP